MTELSASLAPRRKMNSNFFPLRPMLPSASARLTTNGTSTRVDNATAIPVLNDRSKNARRVRMLMCCILLFVKTWRSQQHGRHRSHTRVVGRGRRREVAEGGSRQAIVRGVQEVHGQGPVKVEIALPFARKQDADQIIRHGPGVRQTAA